SLTNNTISGNANAGLLLGIESTGGAITGNTFQGVASYAALELFGLGVSITANVFDADTPILLKDATGSYSQAAILANNNIVNGPAVTIEGAGLFNSIQAAIDAAEAGSTITVAAGEYALN